MSSPRNALEVYFLICFLTLRASLGWPLKPEAKNYQFIAMFSYLYIAILCGVNVVPGEGLNEILAEGENFRIEQI